MEQVKIRAGAREDLPQVLQLIRELAEYERAPHEVVNTVDQMLEDGFGPKPVFGFCVAIQAGRIVGTSIWYYRYSTWKGKRLYLEDIIVTESCRGNGIGHALFRTTMEQSVQDGCNGMSWQVLDWNEPALNFYRKYNAHFDPEWVNCSLDRESIEKQLARS